MIFSIARDLSKISKLTLKGKHGGTLVCHLLHIMILICVYDEQPIAGQDIQC